MESRLAQSTVSRGTQRRFPPKYVKKPFPAIQSRFWTLEIHSKQRYKYKCSVILGDFGSFRNYKGFRIIFPKILDAIYPFTKVRIFLIPLSVALIFNPKILGFLFLRKAALLVE